MFSKEIYTARRKNLTKQVSGGLVFLPGNSDVPFNYPANTFTFRQDSSFLYFFGVKQPDIIGIIDVDSGEDYMFGNDVDIDDIIWMGEQPTMKEFAGKNGVKNAFPLSKVDEFIEKALKQGRKIHFLPAYRAQTKLLSEKLLGIPADEINNNVSEELIKAVVKLRSIKEPGEIEDIERTVDVAYEMHTTSMKSAIPGTKEQEIYGKIEGIALSHGGPVSFPIILSVNGQILHNHHHENILKAGQLMVTDAGAESPMHYCSDITRTTPVGGKFSQKQKEVYETVMNANFEVIKNTKPGIMYKDMHMLSAKVVAQGLKDIGLMKGDVDEAVANGAHALFYPHGLGHMMGMDVHDMEGLGENYVGYDETVQRSNQFGLAFLRMARKLEPGFVITVEPGIYFIPALIDIWKRENKLTDFINYQKLEEYRNFGGIRIEDDILITENACRVLGKPIPKTVKEIEDLMRNQ
ncbi:MAG: aminopeptidase P family protein [Bacteroidetes bacterium]|nr:MAG: aminopeptidase P family protein [Bacteroidota bacterium]